MLNKQREHSYNTWRSQSIWIGRSSLRFRHCKMASFDGMSYNHNKNAPTEDVVKV